MDISDLTSISPRMSMSDVIDGFRGQTGEKETGFDSIFAKAMQLVSETNDYQNAAESAEIQFSLGESTSTHDLLVAQEKANIALQFTVAVRDKVTEAYKEIMNMQI